MIHVPDNFFSNARKLLSVGEVSALRTIVHDLIRTTREFVLTGKPETQAKEAETDYQELAAWYQELSLTWRRIRYFCKNGMVEKAYKDACYLQNEFFYIAAEFGMEEMNLLDSYDSEDLELLARRSNQLEDVIRDILVKHQVKINEYDSQKA